MDAINKYILQGAIKAGICNPGALEIATAADKDVLLKMYIRGIDFCLLNDFPSNVDLVKLGGELLVKHGIYIDEDVTYNDPQHLVLLGGCNASSSVGGYAVSQLYIKHTSKVSVACSGNSFTVIDCFDNAKVSITATDNCKVLVSVYGDAQVVHESKDKAMVKIVNKHKSTY